MTVIFTFFTVLLGVLSSWLVPSYSGLQEKSHDTERKNDINSVFQKLEEHYNEYGEYPTVNELVLNSEEILPGIDPEVLVDPNGKRIQQGDYKYSPSGCTAIGCAGYELSAMLEDSTQYTKSSLN
jgi:Tfp pilus assembly protein PilE